MVKKLVISGMHCHHCIRAVQEALSRVVGVDEVISVEIGSARISSAGGQDEAIAAALEEEGYSLVEATPEY